MRKGLFTIGMFLLLFGLTILLAAPNTTQPNPNMINAIGANKWIGNSTGSSASPLENAWSSCPDTGGNHLNYTNGSGISCGTSSSGGTAQITIPAQGRVTLTSATPVLTSTVSGATTVYYTPAVGNLVPIYDGSNFNLTAFAEVSQATTDSTKSPAAVAASSVYDIFCWVDSGPTNRCTRGPAWTSDTARSAGTALTRVNGILLNNASITNGPAASRGTYVGTIRSNGSSQIDYIIGAAASGGTAGFLGVWNTYNRVSGVANVTDNGASYTYTSATIRQARASAGNQVTYVVGLAEDAVVAQITNRFDLVAATAASAAGGLGFDSTSTFTQSVLTLVYNPTSNVVIGITAGGLSFAPSLGVHIISRNEKSDGVNANTFDANNTDSLIVTVRN